MHPVFERDIFVLKMNSNGSSLIYSTFIGGDLHERGYDIVVDKRGNSYLCGETTSNNFPVTPGAFDITYNTDDNINDDGFVIIVFPKDTWVMVERIAKRANVAPAAVVSEAIKEFSEKLNKFSG